MSYKAFLIVVLLLVGSALCLPSDGFCIGSAAGTRCIKTDHSFDKGPHFYIDCFNYDNDKWRMHCFWYQEQGQWLCENFYTHWRYSTTDPNGTGVCQAACGQGSHW